MYNNDKVLHSRIGFFFHKILNFYEKLRKIEMNYFRLNQKRSPNRQVSNRQVPFARHVSSPEKIFLGIFNPGSCQNFLTASASLRPKLKTRNERSVRSRTRSISSKVRAWEVRTSEPANSKGFFYHWTAT